MSAYTLVRLRTIAMAIKSTLKVAEEVMDRVFVTGSTLYAGDEVRSKSNTPGHNPLGHNPRFLLQ